MKQVSGQHDSCLHFASYLDDHGRCLNQTNVRQGQRSHHCQISKEQRPRSGGQGASLSLFAIPNVVGYRRQTSPFQPSSTAYATALRFAPGIDAACVDAVVFLEIVQKFIGVAGITGKCQAHSRSACNGVNPSSDETSLASIMLNGAQVSASSYMDFWPRLQHPLL